MRARIIIAAASALTVLTTAASAQAAFLTLGTSNPSNKTTTLTGASTGSELRVQNTLGSSSVFGIYGLLTAASTTATSSAAVRGQNNATNGNGSGVYGSHAGAGIGVLGTSKSGVGVYGKHTATSGAGAAVEGDSASTATSATGVYGVMSSTNGGSGSAAVRGENKSTTSSGYGVYGSEAGGGIGVQGYAPTGFGVFGDGEVGVEGISDSGWGVYARHDGNTGTLSGIYGETRSKSPNAVAIKGDVDAFFGQPAAGSTAVVGLNEGTTCCDRYGVSGTGPTGVIGEASIAAGTGGSFNGGFKGVDASSGSAGGSGVVGTSTGSNGNGVVGVANNGATAYGVEGVSSSGYAGFFDGNVKVVNGYMQLSTVAGAPPNGDCTAGTAGRAKVDLTNSKLWICTGSGGWKSTALS